MTLVAYSKVIKTAADVIDSHLANIIKNDLKDKQILRTLKDKTRKIKIRLKITDQLSFLTASVKFMKDFFTVD